MKNLLAFVITAFLVNAASAQTAQQPADTPASLTILPASEAVLADLLWLNRVLVVFADTERDPAFGQQMDMLLERPSDLIERDVIVLTDTNPADPSAIRQELRPRGFGLVLIDKDGGVKLRKPSPWSAREITHSIDKMPSRIEELRDR